MSWLMQGVQNYLLQQLAADVKEAVAALGHKSCTLVAHDWGGGVAWATAGLYGKELVNQLIVMALPHLGVSNTNITSKQYKRSSYMLLFQVGSWYDTMHVCYRYMWQVWRQLRCLRL